MSTTPCPARSASGRPIEAVVPAPRLGHRGAGDGQPSRRRRIIFVDDEPNILAGLRRMLRYKRDEWDMLFADGGDQALQMLEQAPADLVVSDMRMPGMDGAQLLAQVRRRYPATARMILSGHADRTSIISGIGPTQQFLAKPVEVDVLIAALERVLAVREVVSNERLRQLLGGVESLPKPSTVFESMMALASDPDCHIDDVVAVIEQDLATSAEVVRLVNSAFFGLPSRVDTVGRAVHLLGLDVIQALAAAGAVFATGGPTPVGLDPHVLLEAGMRTGTLARAIAVCEAWPQNTVSDIFMAGLLHEVGLLVLAGGQQVQWKRLRGSAFADMWQRRAAETELFGCTVLEASAYLLGMWGFPEGVVNAVADHPAHDADEGAAPAAQLLAVAHAWAYNPSAAIRPHPTGWLSADRLESWMAVRRLNPALP